MTIVDTLSFQGSTMRMLEEGCTLYLETKNKLRLEVRLIDVAIKDRVDDKANI